MESVQEVNLQVLEDKYGADLVEKLQERIDYSNENNTNFKIEVVNDDCTYFAEIAFISIGYAYIYEVSLKRKNICSVNRVGWRACKAIADIQKQMI